MHPTQKARKSATPEFDLRYMIQCGECVYDTRDICAWGLCPRVRWLGAGFVDVFRPWLIIIPERGCFAGSGGFCGAGCFWCEAPSPFGHGEPDSRSQRHWSTEKIHHKKYRSVESHGKRSLPQPPAIYELRQGNTIQYNISSWKIKVCFLKTA